MSTFYYPYEERCKISPNNLITYDYYIGDRKVSNCQSSMKNLELSKQKNDMSKKAQRRLMAAMDWMLLIARPKDALNMKSGKTFSYKLSLVTLTLPCEQLHDDNYIKKYLLNEFLTRLRKEYGLKLYIWKAEKQYNGNIHFHIVIDKYIHYLELNNIWNQILNNHGYIEKYKQNQMEWHKEGFKIRPEMLSYWDARSQLKAYKTGLLTDWQQPISTTDIHSLKKIKNAKAYLSKYLTKNPDTNKYFKIKIAEYKKCNNVSNVPQDYIEELRNEVKEKMKVTGNLWYICRSLSKLKSCTVDLTDDLKKELNELKNSFNDKVERLERCILFKFNIHQLISYGCEKLVSAFVRHIVQYRQMLYPDKYDSKNFVSVPLNIFE